MRVVVWSDLHCHPHRQFATLDDKGRHSRLGHCLKAMDEVARISREHGAKLRLFVGDLFHVRGRISPEVYNPVADWFAREHQGADDIIDVVLPGNHDDVMRADGEHALRSLAHVDPHILVRDGHGYEVLAIGDERLGIGWACHHPDVAVMKARFEVVARKADKAVDPAAPAGKLLKSIFLCHHGVDGVLPGVPDCGLGPDDLYELQKSFEWMFFGDYHRHCRIGEYQAWSVGTPLQHGFADAGKAVGVVVLDTDAGTVGHVPIDSLPRFVVWPGGTCLAVHDVAGNFVRAESSDTEELGVMAADAKVWGALGVEAVLLPKDGERTRGEAMRAAAAALDHRAMLAAWLEKKGLPPAEASAVLALGAGLAAEAGA